MKVGDILITYYRNLLGYELPLEASMSPVLAPVCHVHVLVWSGLLHLD